MIWWWTTFVNPTQFDDASDLNAYPKTLDQDLEKLPLFGEKVVVYAPEVEDLYPEITKSEVYDFDELEKPWRGAHAEDIFKVTIVEKLLRSFMPTKAYFGEKDYQQLAIIHALVKQKELPIQIVNCPIIREADGLAMSSRNTRLTPKQRAIAPQVYQALLQAKEKKGRLSIEEIIDEARHFFHQSPDFELDYFCIADATSLQPLYGKN